MLVECPGGSINVEMRGTGTPILILHGGGLDHHHMLDAIEPCFAKGSGWKRVYIDLPGHGLSSVDESIRSQDDVLGLISAFIDQVFEGQKCALIGESRGSYHAMGLVHLRPDDFLGMMLVVADGMPGATVDWRPEHQVTVSRHEHMPSNLSSEAQTRFERLVFQNTDILQKIINTKMPAAKLADQALASRVKQQFNFSFDLSKPSSLFDGPSLIINGRQDAMAGYQDMINACERYPSMAAS